MSKQFLNEPRAAKQGIDFGQAFAFMADDPRWLPKLSMIAGVTAVASVFIGVPLLLVALAWLPDEELRQMIQSFAEISPAAADITIPSVSFNSSFYLLVLPFGFGLAMMALLFGYFIELVARTRAQVTYPLPPWDNWGRKLQDGLMMVAAYAGYLLLNFAFLVGALAVVANVFARGMNAQLMQVVLTFCAVLPLFAVNMFVIIFLTSICVLPYSASRDVRDFYKWGWVWRRLRHDGGLTGQWFLYGTLATFGFNAAQYLPVVGIVASVLSLFIAVPVQGHLLGQYGAALDERHGDAMQA